MQAAGQARTYIPHSEADVYAAISHPVRRGLIDMLAGGEMPVKALAAPFSMTRPAISQHLQVLREAGLVAERRDGRRRLYRLEPAPLKQVADWVAHYEAFWAEKLHALGDYLDATAGPT
jgi:DNA-binding transcriptional ArsR family regulator